MSLRCPICAATDIVPWLSAPDRFHLRQQTFHLLHCRSCRVVWLDDPPDDRRMGEHYGPAYDQTIMHAAETSEDRWMAHQRTLSSHKAPGCLLDIGCSSGSFLRAFKGTPWTLHGIDFSAVAAARARAVSGAEVFVGDILDASYPPATFDAVTSFDVLEHLRDPRAVLKRIRRWLKPDGIFYVFVPNIGSWDARIFGSYWYGLELPRHLFHYSPFSLRSLLSSEGFQESWLATPPLTYFEQSSRYVYDDMCLRLGVSREPLASAPKPPLIARVSRKALRLTVFSALGRAAACAGAGPAIEAMFTRSLRSWP